MVETHVSIRAAVGRALAGLDRATSLLSSGRGAEAALVFATEAARTRSVAAEHPSASSEARILRGLGTHLETRAEALRTGAPERAEKLAARLERLADATLGRAAGLEARGQAVAAQLLRSIATDSRGQARLLAAGAANTEAIVGHALAQLGQKVNEVAHGRLAAKSGEAAMFQTAFGRLGEAALESRQSFHEAARLPTNQAQLDQLARKLASGALNRPELAALLLQRDERMGPILRSMELLSKGLSNKDPQLVDQARADLQRALRDLRALPALKESIAADLARGTAASFKDVVNRLPELLAARLTDGGAGALARSGPGSLEQQFARLSGLAPDTSALRPAERVATELARALSGERSAQSLGPIESLLLGSQGFYAESGALSSFLREHAQLAGSAASRFELPRSDRISLEALVPAGAHEHAVLVDQKGAVLVRGPGGFDFHEGHAVNKNGERYYFDVESRTDGLRSVVYQSALPGMAPCVRVELEVTSAAEAALSIEDDESDASKEKKKKRRRAAEANQRGAAIAIYRDGASSDGLIGFASRTAAKLSLLELDRVNSTLVENERIRALFSDVAAGVGDMLEAQGAASASGFAQALLAAIEAHGLDPEQLSLLVFWLGEGGEDLVRLMVPGLEAPMPFIRPGAAAGTTLELAPDRNRQPELVESGLLLMPSSIAID